MDLLKHERDKDKDKKEKRGREAELETENRDKGWWNSSINSFVIKPNNLSLILRVYMVEGKN